MDKQNKSRKPRYWIICIFWSCLVFEQLRRNEQKFCSLHFSRVFIPSPLTVLTNGYRWAGGWRWHGEEWHTIWYCSDYPLYKLMLRILTGFWFLVQIKMGTVFYTVKTGQWFVFHNLCIWIHVLMIIVPRTIPLWNMGLFLWATAGRWKCESIWYDRLISSNTALE